jgi:hypothetical protein
MNARFYVLAVCLALAAHCASARANEPESEPIDRARRPGEAAIHLHDPDDASGMSGGPNDASVRIFAEGDAGSGPAVSADAGISSAELAYLVAHLADAPDRLRSNDGLHVRELAAHGADGVRAAAEVLRRYDAQRIPFARTAIEHVAIRSCHLRPAALRRLTRWLEEGVDEEPPAVGTLPPLWYRDPDAAWDSAAVARVLAWAAAGVPCVPPIADAGVIHDASVSP